MLRQFRLERHNEEHLAATREGYEPFDFGPMEAAAERCVREYAHRIGPVERALFGEWAGSDDPHVRDLGEALLAADYGRLAI